MKPHYNVSKLKGQRFGNLKVLEFAGTDKHRNSLWLTKCVCGKLSVKNSICLKTGNTTSCGCKRFDRPSGVYGKPIVNSLGQHFTSIRNASKKTGIHAASITANLRGMTYSAGKTKKGERIRWFYDFDRRKE